MVENGDAFELVVEDIAFEIFGKQNIATTSQNQMRCGLERFRCDKLQQSFFGLNRNKVLGANCYAKGVECL